jgi:hypothetical protein
MTSWWVLEQFQGAENAPNDELKHFVEKIKLKLAMVQILTFRASFGAICTHQSETFMSHQGGVSWASHQGGVPWASLVT